MIRKSPAYLSAFKPPMIYLAGAIRDGIDGDIIWREDAIRRLDGFAIFLNPLAGKSFDLETKKWSMNGVYPGAREIVKQDFWCVDNADIIVANFLSLADGYPSIGTLVEFGRATKTGALIYSIVATNYTGHENTAMFRLHPFIEENSAAVFYDVRSCIDFLQAHLFALSGYDPHFRGYSNGNIPDWFATKSRDS